MNSPELHSGERNEGHVRIEEAWSLMRNGPTAQAYWQLRAILTDSEALAGFSNGDREKIEEASRLLDESAEVRALKLIAVAAGKSETQWL